MLSTQMLIVFVLTLLACNKHSSGLASNPKISCIESEKQALLKFKDTVIDADGFLSSWGSEPDKKDCCNWRRVKCNNHTGHVTELRLHNIPLEGKISPSLFELQHLKHLDLSTNLLEGEFSPIPNHHLGNVSSLRYLSLAENSELSVGNLEWLSYFPLLRHLDLNQVNLSGALPDFTRFSSLRELDLSNNQLTGPFPTSFQLSNLGALNLHGNQISGMLPDLTVYQSLTLLDLGYNSLNGTIDKSVGQLSRLKHLDISSNSLEGVISEAHFSNLTSLNFLDFSFNSFVFKISSNWIPPFQLDVIRLASCKLGPDFPKWLRNQNNYLELDISGAGISDVVPNWFWDRPPNLGDLDLSYTQMNPLVPPGYFSIDLSSNRLKGQIPRLPSNLTALNLSQNMFSGSLSVICAITGFHFNYLNYLDLSSNQLSGLLPNCWESLQELKVMNLANNTLSGKLPSSFGSLFQLQALQLHDNNFTGELPESLKNCTKLTIIDLGGNRFTGKIQPWIGTHFMNLIILSLRFNKFYRGVPRHICLLDNIHVLDFSQNDLSGKLPRCFDNFSALVESDYGLKKRETLDFWYNRGTSMRIYLGNILVQWKGQEREYAKKLNLLKMIDLSSNKFSGKIPWEIVSLAELRSLNLSRNDFTGKIAANIDQMKILESLDLSGNRLSGKIPGTLARLNFLSVLDLSKNNLSGKIPLGTQLQSFNASAYSGNPQLCGVPLPYKCPWEEEGGETPAIPSSNEKRIKEGDEDKFITPEFYITMGVGFAFGFWAIFGTMLLRSMSRYVCFKFLDQIADWFYVTTAVNAARLQRRLRG